MFNLRVADETTQEATVHRADLIEIELASQAVPRMSIDELADELRGDPTDVSDEEEATGDSSRWEIAREAAEDSFKELRWRSAWLGNHYPVQFDGDESVIWDVVSPSSELYRFLVLLRAKQLARGSMEAGTPVPGHLFEELLTQATNAYLKDGQAVRFGLGADGTRGGGLPVSLPAAVDDLAQRMHETAGDNPLGKSGDYGGDAIAWRPFGDRRAGQLVLIAQGTISQEAWLTKQVPRRWQDGRGRVIKLLAYPVPAVGFVESMSLYSSTFWNGAEFNSIPFDRLRIVSLLTDDEIEAGTLEGMKSWTTWAIEHLPT